MGNHFFKFKQFTIWQNHCAMKVCTDACLFGAWVASKLNQKSINVLDIGAGTGLLSLMLAQANNEAKILGLEINENAAKQAKENIDNSLFSNQIKIKNIDAKLFETQTKFDVIISNPPFYENDLASSSDAKNIAKHDDGLLLKDLFKIIKNNLATSGEAFILLPFSRKVAAELLAKQNNLGILSCINVFQTPKHQNPFRLLLHFKNDEINKVIEEKLLIKDSENNYTEEFIELLKPHYLNF